MAAIILTSLGGVAGTAMGGAVGGALGYMAGSMLGNAIDARFSTPHKAHIVGSRLSDLIVQTSSYGKTIPFIYGQVRLAGNIIWALPIKETEHSQTTQVSGGKGGGGGGASVTNTQYTYSVTLAIAVCEGPIDAILNVWADAKLLTITTGSFRLYRGTEDQLPDPLIEAHMGMNQTPAYRGLAYVVIENFQLADYGNRIPNFTFEVKRRAKIEHKQAPAVEDLIKSICMIPGSGEFVYDTIVQYKTGTGKSSPINQHNCEGKVNAVLALDQLMETCPNVGWVAPVVTWFCTSLNIGDCKIMPGVEFRYNVTTQPDSWHVERYSRENAHQITLANDSPIYGGTVSDASLIRYLEEMRRRGLKIMLYPMLFVDKIDKPWRGHITGRAADVDRFFDNEQGYIRFITHYAKLAKGRVDAFVIGSELKNITKIKTVNNQFPAVDRFCEVAIKVREILGPDVKITYAADWSEYHHCEGGWYNMDKLWAMKEIDYIGIDAYFPLTNDSEQNYDEQRIIDGWSSGEGYNYYYQDSKTRRGKTPLAPAYAWKNIEWFWSNYHFNPDQTQTLWQPKSKKIWFTEYGFPSLDCATNQPNVFYDPRCYDGGVPIHSKGRVDLLAQRHAISATLNKWADSEIVENLFLWTWDARPYPYWPNLTSVWADGPLWLRGHWVNGKLGLCRLGDIIAELCLKSGLTEDQFDVTGLVGLVDGYAINEQQSARAMIENLAAVYFFDAVESGGKLRFVSRAGCSPVRIDEDDLLPLQNGGAIIKFRQQELELSQQLAIVFMDRLNSYQPGVAIASRYDTQSSQQVTLDSKIVMNQQFAEMVASINLCNEWCERTSFQFMLPPSYLALEPGDVVLLGDYQLRLTNITYANNRMLKLSAIKTDLSVYNYYIEPSVPRIQGEVSLTPQYKIYLLDLPSGMNAEKDEPSMYVAMANMVGDFKPANLYCSTDGGVNYHYIDNILSEAVIGLVEESLGSAVPELFDYNSKITVRLLSGKLEAMAIDRLLQGENLALIGDEVIQFSQARMLEPGVYRLSVLLRGRLGTEHLVGSHMKGDRFILLNNKLKKIPMPTHLIGMECQCKLLSDGQNLDEVDPVSFVWKANGLKPLAPVNIIFKNGVLSWTRRARLRGSWRNNIDVALDEAKEQYDVVIYADGKLAQTITVDSCELVVPTIPGRLSFRIYQLSGVVGRGW